MTLSPISSLHRSHSEIRQYLLDRKEVSYASAIEEITPKVLLLAAASMFEAEVTEGLVAFAERQGASSVMREFLRRKALERQYHAMFDWTASNLNKFWALFGTAFATYARNLVRSDESLDKSIRAFIEVGSLRNQMVHLNYLVFELDKTADEVLATATAAYEFVSRLPAILDGFVEED